MAENLLDQQDQFNTGLISEDEINNSTLDAASVAPIQTPDPTTPKSPIAQQNSDAFGKLINYNRPSTNPTYDQALNKLMVEADRKNPFGKYDWLDASVEPYSAARKFEGQPYGYRYGVDVEDIYAQDQGFFGTLFRGAGRLAASTVAKTGQGIGYIGGLLNPTNWDADIISKASDNAFSKVFDNLDDKIKNDWFPTYQEASDRDKGFWSRAFTDGDFWMSDVVDGVAFMASSWIPGLALSKLSLGTKLASGLSATRLGITAAEAEIEGAAMTANYLSKSKTLFQGLDKFNAWALATSSEAMFEGKQVKDNIMNSLTYDQYGQLRRDPETGLPFTREKKERIAAANAQNTFIMNAGLLGATNAIELKWIGGLFNKAEGAVAKGLVGGTAFGEDLAVKTATTGIEKFLASKSGAFVKGALSGIAAEGYIEENGQLAIQRINEHYGAAGKIATLSELSDVLTQYGKQTLDATLGKDAEASANIGIGGILGIAGGGIHGFKQAGRDRISTQQAVEAYNAAQQNWLKFGNIYKTETVTTKDEEGNEVSQEVMVFDDKGNPVVDSKKLAGVASSYQSVNGALDESTKTTDKFKRNLLRDSAFGDFVVAHINAGIESSVIDKLNNAATAKPEDLAKLGFGYDETSADSINRYKTLAASIISQNKLINSDIIFDGSEADQARKTRLVKLAADQAVYKHLANELLSESDSLRNELVNSENTALSDSFVSQLRELQTRIKSQEQVIESLYSEPGTRQFDIQIAESVLDNLKRDLNKIEKDNTETLKNIDKDADGMYEYDVASRNTDPAFEQYNKKVKLKGEVLNHIKTVGLEWSKHADAKNGKTNFLNYLNDNILSIVNKKIEENAANQEEQPAEKQPAKTLTATFKNLNDEDDAFEIVQGKVYTNKLPDNTIGTIEIEDVDPENNTAKIKVNENPGIEIAASDLAEMLNNDEWTEKLPANKVKTKLPIKNTKQSKDLKQGDGEAELEDGEDTIGLSRVKKPKFEEIGFNKTFGRHYLDENDTQLNTSYGSDRFYKFTAKYNLNRRGYAFEVVTADNDKFGIRQADFPNDIKVIVTKKVYAEDDSYTYAYVDVNNNIIPEGEATADNVVYRSLANMDSWDTNTIREAYTVSDETTDEELQQAIDKEKEYQASLVERVKEGPVYLNIQTSLPGIQRIEYSSAIGVDGKKQLIKSEMEGRVVTDNPDFSDLKSASNPDANIGLRVSTGKGVLLSGVDAGRLVMQEYTFENGKKIYGDKIVRVFNRELTDDEKENLVSVLSRLSELFDKKYGFGKKFNQKGKVADAFNKKFGNKNTKAITKEENAELDLITEYLRGILNWSKPAANKVSNKYFWVESGLHRGRTKITFKASEIAKNKEELFKNAYHHVNNTALQENAAFTTVKIVKGKAKIDQKFDTYEQYLLSKRENSEVPPVYTSLPLYDSSTPQRSNVQLVWSDPTVEKDVEESETKTTKSRSKKTTAPKTLASVAKASAIDNDIDAFINYEKNSITISSSTFTFLPKKNGVVIQIKNKKGQTKESVPFKSKQDILENRDLIISQITDITGHAYGNSTKLAALLALNPKATTATTTEQAPEVVDLEEQKNNEMMTALANALDPEAFLANRELTAEEKTIEEKIKNEINAKYEKLAAEKENKTEKANPETPAGIYFNIADAVDNAVVSNGQITAAIHQQNVNTNEVAKLAEVTIPIPGGNLNVAKILLQKALMAQLPIEGDEEAPFRLAQSEIEATEDFDNLRKWMSEKLPMIPVKVVSNLIYGKAWGMFKNGAIEIYKNAEIGTGFHEAFEAVWASFLTPDEQSDLASEFRKREGTFYNPFSKQTKNYADASVYDVREMLAEEFRKYILNSQTPVGKAKSFFERLWDFITSLFALNKKESEELETNINKVFKKIKTGGFKNYNPIVGRNVMTPVFRVGKFTQKQSSDVIEGLRYYFFANLFANGNNIDTILGTLDKESSNKLLNDLWNTAFSQVTNNLSLVDPRLKEAVEAHQEDFYSEFRKNLERYGVMFSELDIPEEEITDTLGIRETVSVDPRGLTNTNVRLMLASLPEISIKNGKSSFVRNSMNQPKLVEEDKVHVTLLNELSNVVSTVDENGIRKNVLDLMMSKLDTKYKTSGNSYRDRYGWIDGLKKRLKYDGKSDANSLDKDDVMLRVAFIKSFSNSRFQPEKLIMAEDGSIYNANPLINVNEDRIKNNWSNNLKVRLQNKQTSLVKLDTNGQMVLNRESEEYFDLMSGLKNVSNFDILSSLDVLEKLGIEFSAPLADLVEYQASIREQALQILNTIKSGEVNTIGDLYGNKVVGGRLNTLVNIESKFNSEDNVLSYMNAEGEQQYSVNIPSLLSNVINIVNSVTSQKELVQTCPWLGSIDEEGNVVLNAYQTNSELLKAGGLLFDSKGKRKNNKVSYHVISGTGITEVDGANTAKLQFPERVANEIHYLLKNIVFSNINSDKSTEYGIGIPGKLIITPRDAKNMISFNDNKLVDKYIDQLRDEMMAAAVQFAEPENIQYYNDSEIGVSQLGHFRDILGKQLIDKFNKEVLSEDAEYDDYEDFIEDNLIKIEDKIKKYINETIDSTAEFLKSQDLFVKPDPFGSTLYITDAIDNDTLNDMLNLGDKQTISYRNENEYVERSGYTKEDIDVIAAVLAFNKEILLTEQHKLIYGHPAMYKDLPKRANGATSNKEAFVEDSDIIGWMDNNMVRNDGKQRINEVHQTLKNISFKDVDVASIYFKEIAEKTYDKLIKNNTPKGKAEAKIGAKFDENGNLTSFIMASGKFTGAMKAYMKLTEADAMAMGLPDAIRDILFMSGKFNNQTEKQWDYEIAYEKLVRSGTIKNANSEKVKKSDPQYKSYSKQELASAKEIYDKGDPGYVFQVLKPQYFGYANTDNVTHPVFLKHALQPKFYRHVENTQFEKLYLAAQKEQVDIVGFESGQKVGNVTTEDGKFVPIYNEAGTTNVELVDNQYTLPESLPRQVLFSRFYGIQVEQSSKSKEYVVRGTQVTKVIMSNFYKNGEPINEEVGNLIREYNDTLVKMIQLGKEKLIKELGLEKVENGYISKDLSKLVSTLRAEAEKRSLPDNVIQSIAYIQNDDNTQEMMHPVDTLLNKDKIDNILNSILDSRVISEKMHGKPAVQVASTLYESNPRNFIYLDNGVYKQLDKSKLATLTDAEKKTIQMQSSDLKFYQNKNGKVTGMEVYIAWPYKEISPEELGLTLVNGIYKPNDKIDSNLLRAIGFRIPTQASNSIDSISIKGFLPRTNGDMVVVPSEIVGKSGSDFDIDKLNLYLANASVVASDYSSPTFKKFMIDDLIKSGATTTYANRLVNSLDKATILNINQSTYTEHGKLNKGASTSLSDLTSDKKTQEDYAFFKKSLSNYNAQYRGKKILTYTEPNTTTKEGLQNKLLNLMSELVLRDENYAQLVTPNATDTLKALAESIKDAKVKAGTKLLEDEKSPTYLRSFVGSSITRERYLTAKRMVGIAALHTTFQAMAQVSGLKLNGKFSVKGIKYLAAKDEVLRDINIKLNHHPMLEDGRYDLGHITDMNNDEILSLISEALSGFVDGAKDPFVFDLNFSMNTAGTWFYLQHMGVPVEDIAYFFNQPILDSYFKEQSKNKSNFKKINGESLYNEELFLKVVEPYYNKLTGSNLTSLLKSVDGATGSAIKSMKNIIKNELNQIDQSKPTYTKTELKNAINQGSKADAALQVSVLMNYLEYEAQSRLLSNFIQAIGYDNKKTRTTQENMLQVAKWERTKTENFIDNPEAILDNTFLGEMKKQKDDVFNLFRNFFITLTPELQRAFQPLYDKLDNPDFFFSKEDGINLINRYQNHIISYLLHTSEFVDEDGKTKKLNDVYSDFFTGDNTMAKMLHDYKNNIDPNISDNLVIKELVPVMTDDTNKTDNIMLFRNRMDTFQINNVIEALNNLRDYGNSMGDTKLVEFVDNLAKFSILQSGLNSSFIDYKKVLSTEVYSSLVSKVLDSFKKDQNIDAEQIWRTFHQNNWTNRSIVPKAAPWMKVKGGSIAINPESSYAISSYYVKYIRKTTNPDGSRITKDQYALMKKNGTAQQLFQPMLFEKSDLTDKRGNLLYLPITMLGNGNKMLEIYSDPLQTSILAKNINDEVRDVIKKDGWRTAKELFPDLFVETKKQPKEKEEDDTDEFTC
jgi:hypothetical protein